MCGISRAVLLAILTTLLVDPPKILATESTAKPSGITLTGRIMAKGKGPVENADVYCQRKDSTKSEPQHTTSNKDGLFTCVGLMKETEYVVRVRHLDYRAPEDRTVRPEENRVPLAFFLEPFVLRGIVMSRETSEAIAGALIHCMRQGDRPTEIAALKTEEDGRFECEPLDRRSLYTLAVRHSLYEKREVIDLQPTDPPQDIKIDLRPLTVGARYLFRTESGATLSGQVVRVERDSVQLSFVKSDSALYRRPDSTQTIPLSQIAVVSRPSRKKLYIIVGAVVTATAIAIAGAAH